MVDDQLIQTCHLAYKSRAIITGDTLKHALKFKKVYFVIIASDTSVNHTALLVERLTYYKIPYIIHYTQAELKLVSRKTSVAAIGITNPSLAKLMMTLGG
jgi:ribosomal protein L7Ae-like RNA K-turn-binding protein